MMKNISTPFYPTNIGLPATIYISMYVQIISLGFDLKGRLFLFILTKHFLIVYAVISHTTKVLSKAQAVQDSLTKICSIGQPI